MLTIKSLSGLLLLLALLGCGTALAATRTLPGTPYVQASNNSALPLQSPPGTAVGDVLLAQVVAASNAVITAPNGWNPVPGAGGVGVSGYLQQRIYYRVAATAGAQSYPFKSKNVSGVYSVGVLLAVTGADSINPICGTGMQADHGSGVTAPNIQGQPPTCPIGSQRLAFFAGNNGSVELRLNLENSATAGPSATVGSGSSGGLLSSSYYTMTAATNGESQSGTFWSWHDGYWGHHWNDGYWQTQSTDSVGASVIVNPGTPVINHIQLELTGTSLICAPSTVTVKACTNAATSSAASCTPATGTATTVTLSADNGAVWGTNPLAVAGSATTMLRKTTVGGTTLGATSSVSVVGATTCYLDGVQLASCQVPFADSALLLTIPVQTAGVLGQMTVSPAAECIPAFKNVTRSIKFWPNYNDPDSGTKPLAVNGTSVAANATTLAASTSSTGAAVNLAFDVNGTASVPLKYDDAGQLLLNARYDGSTANTDSGLVMKGSATFVTVPYGLCVDSPDTGWACAAADLTCSKYRKAGENFNLRVTGKASSTPSPTATPTPAQLCAMPSTANYRQNGLALSTNVVAPSGGSNGALRKAVDTIDISAGGTATISDQTQSEVGVFTFTATPAINAYFGQTVKAGTSANFGRFVPHHFNASAVTVAPRSDLASCSSSTFTYLDEPLRVSGLTLTAVTSAGNTTKNYVGDFARLDLSSASTKVATLKVGAQHTTATLPAMFTNFYSSDVTTNRLNFAYSGTSYTDTYPASDPDCPGARMLAWCKGKSQIALDITLKRAAAPDGPFSGVVLGISPIDGDDIVMGGLDFQRSYSGSGSVIGDGQKIVELTNNELRFGRLRLSNAFGSDRQDLKVPVQAQYWSGKSWVRNVDDTCTKIPVSAIKFDPLGATKVSSDVTLGQSNGDFVTLTCPYATCPMTSKPASTLAGKVSLCVDLGDDPSSDPAKNVVCDKSWAKLPYLQGKWPPGTIYANDPLATATFGVYSPETKKTVHIRELY